MPASIINHSSAFKFGSDFDRGSDGTLAHES